MRKNIITLFCMLVLMLTANNAVGNTFSPTFKDSSYVGAFSPDTSSSETDELNYIQHLVGMAVNTFEGSTETEGTAYAGQDWFDRYSDLMTPMPYASAFYDKQENGSEMTLSSSDFDAGLYYVLGKYDAGNAGAMVWLLNLNPGDVIDLPDTYTGPNGGNQGLSHTTLFSTTPVPVPSAILLLCFGLAGVVGGRRKLNG